MVLCYSRSRLLSDGNVIYISGNRRWEVLDGVDFCLDGMQNVDNDESSPISKDDGDSWPESDQVLIICATDFKSAKSVSFACKKLNCI